LKKEEKMDKVLNKCFLATLMVLFAAFLIVSLTSMGHSAEQKEGVQYTCPMKEHADVVSDKPGKCPKCGMDLVAKETAVTKYTCPMKEHSDVVSDKPGKCPKCGMELVPMKTESK